jgi:hypothetical protein
VIAGYESAAVVAMTGGASQLRRGFHPAPLPEPSPPEPLPPNAPVRSV